MCILVPRPILRRDFLLKDDGLYRSQIPVKSGGDQLFHLENHYSGLFRTEKGIGTQYELVFKPGSSANIMDDTQLFRIRLFRPFAPLRKIAALSVAKTETIHFIVPLSGRADTFR